MWTIRPATPQDLPGIFAIYDQEVLRGTATFETQPRSPVERLDWLAAHPIERYPILVAQGPDPDGPNQVMIAGWARLYPWSPRPAYARSAENSVYIHQNFRGRGLGRTLLDALIARAREIGVKVIIARIAEGNPASVRLHQSAGFRPIGTMRRVGEKFGRLLDVTLMDLHLDE